MTDPADIPDKVRIIRGPTRTPPREERQGRIIPPDNGTIIQTPRYKKILTLATKHERVHQGITAILEILQSQDTAIVMHNRTGEKHNFDPTKENNAQSVLQHYVSDPRPSHIAERARLNEVRSILYDLQAAAGQYLRHETEAEHDIFRELNNLSRLVLGNMHTLDVQRSPEQKSTTSISPPGKSL